MCAVYILSALVTSGMDLQGRGGFKEYFHFIKSQCLPVGILVVALFGLKVEGRKGQIEIDHPKEKGDCQIDEDLLELGFWFLHFRSDLL